MRKPAPVSRGPLAALLALACSLVVLVPAPAALAADAKAPATAEAAKSALARPHTLTTGELVALLIPQLMMSFDWWDDPVLAVYERAEDRIGIYIYGDEETADAAKEAFLEFDEEAMPKLVQWLAVAPGVALAPEDFHIAYYNVDSSTLVLERVRGEYRRP